MANYKPIVPIILDVEGGYGVVAGMPTNKGITWTTFKSVAKQTLGIDPTDANFRKLTDAQVDKIVKVWYWDTIKGDSVNNQAIAMYICDWYFNTGNKAIRRVQEVLNKYFGENLPGTIVLGKQTLAAVNRATGAELIKYLHLERGKDYSTHAYASGLTDRIDRVYQIVVSKYLNSPYVPGIVARVYNAIVYA